MKEHKETIEISKGSGRAGFLLTLEEILKLPRLQSITVDARGKITYTRFLQDNEPPIPLKVDLETVSPYAAIRNGEVAELQLPMEISAAIAVGLLFREISMDGLYPIAFVGGADSTVWTWLKSTTGIAPYRNPEEFFGLPLYRDRMIEDYVLFLCAGYTRSTSLVDTQKSYKILMPWRET